jgi:8-amino-7-oxononanoate synthase
MPASQAAPDQYDSHDGGAGTATAVESAPGNGQAARAAVAKDILAKCTGAFMEARIAMKQGYYPYFLPLAENEGTEVEYHGRRLIMAGSNNYLGLTTDERVKQAAIEAINRYGTSCTGSRFLNGTLEMHERLEHELAAYVGKQSALVFSTGFQVNLGTISALVGRDDYVLIDRDDHASIVDGCRLAMGDMKRFHHNSAHDLERVLSRLPADKGKLVVVDGVFSMGGDIAPLPEYIPICKAYGARLMVDDAHSIGVLAGGRGTAAHFGVTDDVDLIMCTFSKAFASLGGFIAGDEEVMHYIKHSARSLIFSASMPPSNTAAALAALEIMRAEPERAEQVMANAHKVRTALRALGFNTGHSETAVVPVIIGDDMKTIFVWNALFKAGVFVNPVLPPGVPPNQALLRTSYMATHTDEQLDRVIEIFARVGKQFGLI